MKDVMTHALQALVPHRILMAAAVSLAMAALCLLADSRQAWPFTGRDIALRMDQVDASRTGESDIVMVVRRGEQSLVRAMNMKRKKYPDCEKQLIRFYEPSDVRDTMYLSWIYKEVGRDDDMWIYMPAESLVRRVSGGGKKGAFMRSDYANEDIEKREVDDDRHTLLREEELFGVACYVLEMLPVHLDKTNYSKRVVWIRKDIWLPARVDFYDLSGKPCKQLIYGGYKQMQGIWTSTRQMMKTLFGGSETLLETRHIRYDIDLSDEMFRHTDLKR
ncbi:MAG: outer membrane lipoprotein-sorting protein [Desulfocurvibacter africanus]